MVHTYTVSGMTCKNCKASVEDSLSKLSEVGSVSVNLETNSAKINMTSHVELEKLQDALSDKYTLSENKDQTENKDQNVFDSTGTSKKSKPELKQLFPLALIFGYLLIASIFLNYKTWKVEGIMLDFMGLFYIVFSFFKFLDLKGFSTSFRMYDPLAKKISAYGWIYPFIEAALGLMFLMRLEITTALIITLIILGMTTLGVTKALLGKKSIQCACLGTTLNLPMTKATFIENTIMILMALIMLSKTIL